MNRDPRSLTILDLIDKAQEYGCNVGVMAIQLPEEETVLELRFSKQGYHISKKLTKEQLTTSVIDLVTFEAEVMIQQLEDILDFEATE